MQEALALRAEVRSGGGGGGGCEGDADTCSLLICFSQLLVFQSASHWYGKRQTLNRAPVSQNDKDAVAKDKRREAKARSGNAARLYRNMAEFATVQQKDLTSKIIDSKVEVLELAAVIRVKREGRPDTFQHLHIQPQEYYLSNNTQVSVAKTILFISSPRNG